MPGRIAVRLAPPFGIFLAVAEVIRNWGNWGFWPFWVVDYLAVALLLSAAYASSRRLRGARAFLAGAWGFTCAMFYMSFFAHVERIQHEDHGPIEQKPLTMIIGMLFAITVIGFGASMYAAGKAGDDDEAVRDDVQGRGGPH